MIINYKIFYYELTKPKIYLFIFFVVQKLIFKILRLKLNKICIY